MADMQISNAGIDGGAWVDLQGVSFTPSYKKNNEANPINGTSTAKVNEGDRIGVDTPVFTIKGIINVDDFADTAELWSETPSAITSKGEDGTSNASRITVGYLLALWRNLANETKVRVYFGDPDDQKQWKNWDNTSTDIYVVVDDINPVPAQDSEGLHFMNYSIVMREVEPDGTYTT